MRVLEHNRLDVLSLAALSVLACQWVEEERAEDPRDIYCLARVFERARLFARSDAQYRRVLQLEEADSPWRAGALLRLALRARRRGDHPGAAALWQQAAEQGDWRALRALAVHHEHQTHDLQAALAAAERGLAAMGVASGPGRERAQADFQRRRRRVLAKLARVMAPAAG